MKKLQVWGCARADLPPHLQQYHVEAMVVLGHYIERTGGEAQLLAPGDERGSFTRGLLQLRERLDKLWLIRVQGGPPPHTNMPVRACAQNT